MSDLAPSLYGYAIDTREPLRFLRRGGGRERLAIVAADGPRARPADAPLLEWTLQGAAVPAQATLYRVPAGYAFWTTDAGAFRVDLDAGVIEVPAGGEPSLKEQRLAGFPMILAYRHRGDCPLHAAAVEVDGGAAILAGPSRFGKTTLAFAFHRLGYRVLSEDLVCCRPSTGEVLPGPAVLRMRPDVYGGTPPAGTQLVYARPDRVFLGLSDDRRGGSTPVPVRGIFFLHEGDSLEVAPVRAAEAMASLWHLSFHLPTAEDRSRAFRELGRLAGAAPAWALRRPMRLDLLDATVDAIAERVALG